MEIAKILEREKNNRNEIFLYREGLFWKAYERSAFHFVTGVHAYQASKKFVKTVGCEVVSIGFPFPVLAKLKSRVERFEEEDKQARLVVAIDSEVDFELWKESCALRQRDVTVLPDLSSQNQNSSVLILNEIVNFSMESKTPMECMMWIVELKQKVNFSLQNG